MCNLPALYPEISAQINRFRLIRVLFVVEIILLIAFLNQLKSHISAMNIIITIIIIASACINYGAIDSRFHRYCRAVERSYYISKLKNQEKWRVD